MFRQDRFRILLLLIVISTVSACGEADQPWVSTETSAIEILIDEMGVPHIYAATDEAAFYGAGYQMAADRLYQMESLRRFSLGRLSEVIGEAGLERDMQARTFDFPRWGRLDAALMRAEDPERARLLDAWVKGINRRIREICAGEVPLPFGYGPEGFDFLPEPWSEDDPYIILKGAGFALDKTLEFEIAVSLLFLLYAEPMSHVEIFKPAHPVFGVPPEDRPEALDLDARVEGPHRIAEPMGRVPKTMPMTGKLKRISAGLRAGGSNSWAVDGRFTATGRPLIAGDPHLSFDFFGAPYPMHINSSAAGGTYNVIGFAYPGTPGIALGHNGRVMWTATSAFGDVNDVWNAILVSNRALMGREWVPVKKRKEEILVRRSGDPVGQGRVVKMTYQEVEGFGVVIPWEIIGIPIGGPYLTNWTGFRARPTRWFMELNRVSSLDEFEEAVDRMREMNYNFVAADASGISYRVGVDVPFRSDVHGDRGPWKSMWSCDDGSLWTGEMLPRSQMPRSRAYEQGWIVTANTDPFGFTEDGRIDNDPWYYGSFFAPGYRAKRIAEKISGLTAQGSVRVEDMMNLQRDTYSPLAEDILPLLAEAYARIGIDPDLARFQGRPNLDAVVRLLTVDWDRRMNRESAGALAFQAYIHFLASKAVRDDIPLAYDMAMSLQSIFVIKVAALALGGAYPEGGFVLQGGRDAVLLSAASRAGDWLKKTFGRLNPPPFAFADRKRTRFDDAFGFGMEVFTKATDGGEDTINVSQNISFSETEAEWVSTYVSVERSVGTFDENGTPQVFVNFPVGAHADPDSEETRLANDDYIEGRYRRLLFHRSEIEAALKERIVLMPEVE